jgi:N-methylhydantoinase B
MAVRAGDTFVCEGPAGGGYGDPHRRDPARVAADVADGFITAGTARDAFGVVVGADGGIDVEATAKLRKA